LERQGHSAALDNWDDQRHPEPNGNGIIIERDCTMQKEVEKQHLDSEFRNTLLEEQCLLLSCTDQMMSEVMKDNMMRPFSSKGILYKWYNERQCLLVCKDSKQAVATMLLNPINCRIENLSDTVDRVSYYAGK
jgi:hypothetical protein